MIPWNIEIVHLMTLAGATGTREYEGNDRAGAVVDCDQLVAEKGEILRGFQKNLERTNAATVDRLDL